MPLPSWCCCLTITLLRWLLLSYNAIHCSRLTLEATWWHIVRISISFHFLILKRGFFASCAISKAGVFHRYICTRFFVLDISRHAIHRQNTHRLCRRLMPFFLVLVPQSLFFSNIFFYHFQLFFASHQNRFLRLLVALLFARVSHFMRTRFLLPLKWHFPHIMYITCSLFSCRSL